MDAFFDRLLGSHRSDNEEGEEMMKQNHIGSISKQRQPAEAGPACVKTPNILANIKCQIGLKKM